MSGGEEIRLSDMASSDYQTIDRPMAAADGVPLEGERVSFRDPDRDPPRKSGKEPKKILHFSDGTLEVYSSSDDESDKEDDAEPPRSGQAAENQGQNQPNRTPIDPKNLSWIPWMVHYTWWFGSGFVGYCDYIGEKLAWGLGITSPKYYYEIEDFKRQQEEEKERKERMGVEAGAGWTSPQQPVTSQQQPVTSQQPHLDEAVDFDPQAVR